MLLPLGGMGLRLVAKAAGLGARQFLDLSFDLDGLCQSLGLGVPHDWTQGDQELDGVAPRSGNWTMPEERVHSIPGFTPKPAEGAIAPAKGLLADAGYPDALDARLVVRNDEYFTSGGVFLRDQFEKIGYT